MNRLSKSTIRLKRSRDQFQLPRFNQRTSSKSYNSNSQKIKKKSPYKNHLNSVYKNIKVSRGMHNSITKSSSVFKKTKLRKNSSKSNFNIFDGFNSKNSRRSTSRYAIGQKLENLNFRISSNFNSGDNHRGSYNRQSRPDFGHKRNNFLGSDSGLLRNSLKPRDGHKRQKKRFGFSGGKFAVHTASTDNFFESSMDEHDRSSLMKTRERKQRRKERDKDLVTPKDVTAKSWLLYNLNSKKVLGKKSEVNKKQISSLNKIATFLTALKIVKELNLNTSKIYVRVTKEAAGIGGTSSGLKENDVLTMYDLFYGMMLPSGNDSALCLAQTLGYMMDNSMDIEASYPIENPVCGKYARYWQSFVSRMNKLKYNYKLTNNTNFTHPHGLSSLSSYSTCVDVLKLSLALLKTKFGKKVVSTRRYKTTIVRNGQPVNMRWNNSNRMLGWDINCLGLKTGYNKRAFGCLVSYFRLPKGEFMVVLIKSLSLDSAFRDCIKIMKSAGLILENEEKELKAAEQV